MDWKLLSSTNRKASLFALTPSWLIAKHWCSSWLLVDQLWSKVYLNNSPLVTSFTGRILFMYVWWWNPVWIAKSHINPLSTRIFIQSILSLFFLLSLFLSLSFFSSSLLSSSLFSSLFSFLLSVSFYSISSSLPFSLSFSALMSNKHFESRHFYYSTSESIFSNLLFQQKSFLILFKRSLRLKTNKKNLCFFVEILIDLFKLLRIFKKDKIMFILD